MRSLAKFGLFFGLVLGSFLSVARIVQGGHFISDAYIAALIMWLTSYFADYFVFEVPMLAKIRKDTLQAENDAKKELLPST